ncbi:deaminase domain-containing protein, partial [Paenibacillus marchantiophytorum]|uniref:deaminase domain-containing protein n=1 Tax=Paenibacillus marchantiophytorum TaxID=1619310 RepID=UPI0027E56C39
VVQKIVSGLEHLAKTITHTNPLKLLIAPVPKLLVEVAKEFQVQIQTATIEKQLGSLKQDKTVAQLLDQRAKGTPAEQKWANERLEQIKEAYTELGRSQAAYHMYAKFGNQAYMDEATKEMEAERIKLGQLGIASSFYDENVDVSSFYAGSALLACKYNPTKNDHSEMPQDNVLRSLILTSLSKGNEGEWAIRRLEGSTETNRSELRAYDPNKTVTLEELFRQESDRYTKEQLEEIWNQLSSEDRKAISKQFAQNWFKQALQGIGGEIANGAMTSWESFKEIGGDLHTGLQTRGNKALDSPSDFINWLTFGASGGIQEGLKARAVESWDSTYDFFNWLTVGGIETVNGAINPDKPLSKEHWLASLGVASMVYGGAKGQWGTKLEPRSLGRDVVEGTGNGKILNKLIDSLYERAQNIRNDINREIEKIRNSDEYKNLSSTQRKKLDRKLDNLTFGNVAVADVNIPGIKKEFQAHSQIHSSDSVGSNVGDLSISKVDKSLETYVDDQFPRFNDTEAKILEDIASQIKDTNVKGQIDLFTELDACQSCSNLIMEFRRKFPNIQLNVYSKSMR